MVTPLDKKGAAKPTRTLSIPFPDLKARPTKTTPFVPPSKSDKDVGCDNSERELGKLDAKDDANFTTYRFVVCRLADKSVTVHSNFLTGTVWSAKDLAAADAECTPAGAPYSSQGPGDERSISYRLCGTRVEVEAVTLDGNWKKKAPKKLSATLK
jgi:hypothetical protein